MTDKKQSAGPIVVTGANGGIGAGLIDYLLGLGHGPVVAVYRGGRSEIEQVFARHEVDSVKHLHQADLTDEASVQRLLQNVVETFGAPWAVLNVAGGSTNKLSWKMELSDFDAVIRQNLYSAFLVNKTFIPSMRDAGRGRLIQISSVVASMGVVGAAHYAASKGALESLTRALSQELASKSITANAIALGYFECGLITHVPDEIQTDIRNRIPLKRFGSVAEVGALVDYLLNPLSDYMTGQVLHLNGGLRL